MLDPYMARSEEQGGWLKTSQPKHFNFCTVLTETCRRSLSWWKTTSNIFSNCLPSDCWVVYISFQNYLFYSSEEVRNWWGPYNPTKFTTYVFWMKSCSTKNFKGFSGYLFLLYDIHIDLPYPSLSNSNLFLIYVSSNHLLVPQHFVAHFLI